jgi:hypothetical protein
MKWRLLLLLAVAGVLALSANSQEGTGGKAEGDRTLGPIIEKVDWDEKPLGEAIAEVIDLTVKKDPTSRWRNIRVDPHPNGQSAITLHLRNVSAAQLFQTLVDSNLGRMHVEGDSVHLQFNAKLEIELRVVVVPRRAFERLGIDEMDPMKALKRFGIQVHKVEYSSEGRSLILRGPARECELVRSLVELADRVNIDVKE